jgi:hypothetical protein
MGLEKEEGIPPRVGVKWERISTGVHRTKVSVESVLTISQKCSVTLSKTSIDLGPEGLDLNILVLKYAERVDFRYTIIRGSFGGKLEQRSAFFVRREPKAIASPLQNVVLCCSCKLNGIIKHPPPAPR